MISIQRLLEMAYYNEMANLRSDKTGLSMVIYASPRDGLQHGPRIKVFDKYGDSALNTTPQVPITVSDSPQVEGKFDNIKDKDVSKVKQWIKLNKQLLIDFYNHKISKTEFEKSIKKIS